MEKAIRRVIVGVILVASWIVGTAGADVLLARPQPGADPNEETYAESRWGQAPVHPLKAKSGGRSPASDSESSDEEMHADGEPSFTPHKVAMEEDLSNPPVSGDRTPAQALVPSPKKGIQEQSLIVGDTGFFPQVVQVTRNVPVRLFVTGSAKKNKDGLCMMMDAFQVRRQIKVDQIEEIEFTPKTAGKYRIFCPINGAEATLLVKEARN